MKVKITKKDLPWIDYDKSYKVESKSDDGVIIVKNPEGRHFSFVKGEYEEVTEDAGGSEPVQENAQESDEQPENAPAKNYESEPAKQNAPVEIRAYNVKTKQKNVLMVDAVITKTAKGAFLAQGKAADNPDHKLTTLMNEEKAMAAINAGVAKQGW